VVFFAGALVVGWRVAHRAGTPAPSGASSAPSAVSRGGELTGSFRSDAVTYDRYIDDSAAGDLLALLTQAPLVHVNRTTDQLEPWLAESWTRSDDGLVYTLKLRKGIAFSDGVPLTSADVVFSFRALYDPKVQAVLADGVRVAGKPLVVEAPDPDTVVIRFPAQFAPGLRMIDMLPILPRHKLEAALNSGKFTEAWGVTTPVADLAGLGPFVLSEHIAGQRMVFVGNPRYWRADAAGARLPYLDKLTILIIPDQNTEALRMEAGTIDLMVNGDIRPEDYATFKRAADQGRLRLIDGGVGTDSNLLWFNLSKSATSDARRPWLREKAFRQAVSCAVDRQAIVNTVYLGAAVPIYGAISPGNRTWYLPSITGCQHDVAKARTLLASLGLSDRNGDGMLEDAAGAPARFSILTQRGHTIRERTSSVIQEQLRQVGLTVDVVPLEAGAMQQRWAKNDYDSIYYGVQGSATDPALNPEYWYSSGYFHFWNPRQPSPATEWERRVDDLMRQQSVPLDLAERQRIFADVQAIMADELPAIYFVAPRVTLAVSRRVANAQPAPQIPQLLWAADTIAAREK
jgi:peptide/nickel transport system substrate-binding protein